MYNNAVYDCIHVQTLNNIFMTGTEDRFNG